MKTWPVFVVPVAVLVRDTYYWNNGAGGQACSSGSVKTPSGIRLRLRPKLSIPKHGCRKRVNRGSPVQKYDGACPQKKLIIMSFYISKLAMTGISSQSQVAEIQGAAWIQKYLQKQFGVMTSSRPIQNSCRLPCQYLSVLDALSQLVFCFELIFFDN